MFYEEFTPHFSLAQYVRCIWVFEAGPEDGPAAVQQIVPDGFPELILHYGDHFHEIDGNGAAQRQSRIIFAGQISRPLTLQPGMNAGVMGVRFWPAAAQALLRLPMVEVTDQRLDVAALLGAKVASIIDEVASARDSVARVDVMERFLSRRLLPVNNVTPPNLAVAHCVAALHQSGGRISVDALARGANLSSRQLQRRFLHEVGISPRLLGSIFRFRKVFDFIEQPGLHAARWTDAAMSAGYFDQAHMIRDFKRFAGQQPQAFYKSLHGLAAAMVSNADS
jgi:AraC-like DNA-binding protein